MLLTKTKESKRFSVLLLLLTLSTSCIALKNSTTLHQTMQKMNDN